MLQIILNALAKFLDKNKNADSIEADVLIWLKQYLTNETDIETIDFWLDEHNRCKKCGSILTPTYIKNTPYMPFKRTAIKHCLNCRKES